MGEGRRFGGRAWVRHGAAVAAVVVLAGCASTEEIQHQRREADGYYKQGMSFIETDQQRAFVAFQKSIQLNPDNYDPHYALGHIYFERKEYANAEREFRTCLAMTPESGEAMNYLGRTLIALSRLPEAVEVLRKAITLPLYSTPDFAYTNLGQALQLQGDTAGAIRSYEDALKIDPPNVPRMVLYLQLGSLYKGQGENARAREALAKSKALDPDGPVGKEAEKLLQQIR